MKLNRLFEEEEKSEPTYRDWPEWRLAMDFAHEVHLMTRDFPEEERHALTDRLQWLSCAAATRLSTAWRNRYDEDAYLAALGETKGIAAEIQTLIEISLRQRYICEEQAEDLDSGYEILIGRLSSHCVFRDLDEIGETADQG